MSKRSITNARATMPAEVSRMDKTPDSTPVELDVCLDSQAPRGRVLPALATLLLERAEAGIAGDRTLAQERSNRPASGATRP
jgi:hypothetical protein